jgi:2-amino-4-hydroxy-6-hydroxymethyldihydropteridine diphosphokinase
MHQVHVLMGSNIAPVENLPRAGTLLREAGCQVTAVSRVWETTAVGSGGPNFFNAAVSLDTHFAQTDLKYRVLRSIETIMGRRRSVDKFAPRPIDLDVIVYDEKVVDDKLWSYLFVALPVSEIVPDLIHPQSGLTLSEIAASLLKNSWAAVHPEINLFPG